MRHQCSSTGIANTKTDTNTNTNTTTNTNTDTNTSSSFLPSASTGSYRPISISNSSNKNFGNSSLPSSKRDKNIGFIGRDRTKTSISSATITSNKSVIAPEPSPRRFGNSANNTKELYTSASTSNNTSNNSSPAGLPSTGRSDKFLKEAKRNLRRSPSPPRNKFKNHQHQHQQSISKPVAITAKSPKRVIKSASNTSISHILAKTSPLLKNTPPSKARIAIAKWTPSTSASVSKPKPASLTRTLALAPPPARATDISSIVTTSKSSINSIHISNINSNSNSNSSSNNSIHNNSIHNNNSIHKESKDQDHTMHESGDQSNVWVRHSLIVSVLNPKPTYGSSTSNITNNSSSSGLNVSFSSNTNINGNTPSTPLRKTPFKKNNSNHGYSNSNSINSTPSSFLPQKSSSMKGVIGTGTATATPSSTSNSNMNDDASTSASTTSSSLSNITTPAKWGWVKAFLLNNDAFSQNKSKSIAEKEKAPLENTAAVPAWRLKNVNVNGIGNGKGNGNGKPSVSRNAPPTPERASLASTTLTSTPTVVSLKIIDLESEFHGQTLDIPISMIAKDKDSNGNSSDNGNGATSIFGDAIVMANAWSSFTSIPEKSGPAAPSTPVKATPKSKWSAFETSARQEVKSEDTKGNDADAANVPSDLTNLTHLHEPAVVYCLRSRYAMNEIYTSTGPILLALNPFKDVKDIYGDDLMRRYCERGQGLLTGVVSAKKKDSDGAPLPPHVYAVADNSYRAMMRAMEDATGDVDSDGSADQSILVSGESGAGKTVTTKIIMKYLAALSKRSSNKKVEKKPLTSRWSSKPQNFSSPPQDAKGTTSPTAIRGRNIEQQVLESNPILESFGNARTIRNDNSSRFGKFIEIKFTSAGKLMGASVDSYLLEKVRLINQAEGERNYHIFYELLSGASGSERKEFLLGRSNTDDFIMTTSPSETYKRRDGVRDDTTFASLRKAMGTMGFDTSNQKEILSIVSSLLHLSNTTFAEDSSGCTLDSKNASLDPALKLMGVSGDALEKALCCVNIEAGGETVVKKLFLDQSIKAKEALIKATYGALFTYLVQRINNCINGGTSKVTESDDSADNEQDTTRPRVAAFIGVLDIFGFESFEKNSFEQLCINYCNESLQQQFNKFVFKLEQAEYESEGIQWKFITFPDNQNVLDLIDKKRSGILSILDEQSFLTQCTDQSFAQLVYQKCGGGRAGKGNAFSANSRQMALGVFSINHYAGPVEYDSNRFLETNKDELPNQIDELLHSSDNSFLRLLANVMTGSSKSREGDISKPAFKQSSLKRITVGGQFSSQLQLLRKRIDATSPHYIRCLKPNDKLEPNNFDSAVIADQLRCAGILEAVRVSRVGYPQRYLHGRFVQRYQVLAMKELQLRRKDASSTFSSPVGFGFHGGFIPQKNKNERSPPPSRRNTNTPAQQQKRLNPDQECKILVTALARQLSSAAKETGGDTDDYENIPPSQNSWVSPGKQKKQSKWGTPGCSSGYTPIVSKKKQELNLMDVGIQMGKTKVFLRQHAFEVLEVMRGRIKSAAATVLNSVFRMYLKRRRYVIMRNEYRTRVLQRSRMIQEGGVVNEDFLLEAANASFDCGNKFEFRENQISLHREEDDRSLKDFKWVMVDNRWVKKDNELEEWVE